MTPIRVVRIIDRLNIGGPAKHVVWLTAGLNAAEFETVLITGTVPAGEGDMSYFARKCGVTPVVVKQMSRELGLRDVVVVARLLSQLFKLKPRIVHTHKSKAGAAGRVAAMLYKWMTPSALWLKPRQCSIVHTYHGHVFHSYYGAARTRLFLAVERALARACTDRIVTVSEQQRQEISERFRVGRPEQFRVIPLGIDFDESGGSRGVGKQTGCLRSQGPLREELGASADEVLVGTVGRLSEVKNHSLLLKSAARLVNGNNGDGGDRPVKARFVIIGDGHLRAKLESLSRELGIADKVTFTGFRDDVLSLYEDLDVVALTSLNEGTPLTLIEAMSRGCPVAATHVGGVVDLMGARRQSPGGFSMFDHGVTAPTGDAEGFARALRFVIDRRELRREMGERGREFVRARLSRERLVSDIEALYRELTGRAEC